MLAKKGPLGKIWLAAHMGEKKVPKVQVKIPQVQLEEPEVQLHRSQVQPH